MKRRAFGVLALAMLLAASAAAQMKNDYLDLFIVKVKPDKRTELDATVKKMVDANRKNKGDSWITSETMFGEQNTVYFISTRANYAAVEEGMGAFMGAVNKAFGKPGTEKLFQSFSNSIVSARGEVRQRRWDLSFNPPADAAAMGKMVGEARYSRTTVVRVRPGRTGDYVAALRTNKAALEKAGSRTTTLVSQSATGQTGTNFYLTTLRSSMAGFDPSGGPTLPQALGEEGFQKYLKTVQEVVLFTETYLNRLVPELSNAPEEIAAVAPDFWRPKPMMAAAKPKPKTE